ncbi:hypothetical protein CBW24_05160 [Pacificitalea manganoxidans]|uniref:Uncharacterized protein n=1 Tax=Pacificitalea manganoxidans TaxID=1411902 RepID=A0A291LY58_9RHOB|nr:hypothetical protein [Pacificitalea manganoxidans]ATI41448.1 hypothetical protein CBW24_05160 [Pacificitalea manganoxidans]MDR6308863.1 hypothetical protein [Pacificitalea manganoxidans]
MSSACPPVSAFLLSALVALPALAQERPMSAAEFEAYTTGKTLTFSSDGYAYGMEEYDADRRVRWSFLDGDCREGRWYPQDQFICFVYERTPETHCWTFYDTGQGLRAVFEDDPGAVQLSEAGADEPMHCLGPDVGV